MQQRVEVLEEELKKPMSEANRAFMTARLTKYRNALRDLDRLRTFNRSQ